jgi:hypothetical protein
MTFFRVIRVDAAFIGHAFDAKGSTVWAAWLREKDGISGPDKGEKEKRELHNEVVE